jgi:hypothetical protein
MMREGFLSEIVDNIDIESEEIQFYTVQAFSLACEITESRRAIANNAYQFLVGAIRKPKSLRLKLIVSLTLVKIIPEIKDLLSKLIEENVVDLFSKNLKNESKISLEGLAYLSIHGIIKQKIVSNQNIIQSLIDLMISGDRTVQFGVVTIFNNILSFPSNRSDENQQLKKLCEMANPNYKGDPLNEDFEVEKRIDLLVKSSIITSLVNVNLEGKAIQESLANIYLSISRKIDNRGALIQSGAARQLLKIAASDNEDASRLATHALSRISITINPELAFKGEMLLELIRPLVNLLKKTDDGLVKFECLLALTNIAGIDDNVRSKIISLDTLAVFQNIQFSENKLLRRAATEAICNMIFHPQVMTQYMEPKNSALKIMVALSGDDDFYTKRAALGAIAILSAVPEFLKVLLTFEKILPTCLELLKDPNVDLVHRSSEIVKNIIVSGPDNAKRMISESSKVITQLTNHPNPFIAENCKICKSLIKS